MKRRAKLSLAATNGTDKRQAAGFGPTTTIPPQTKSSKVRTHANEASTQNPGHATTQCIPERRMWPSSRQIAKALLVVAASALAFYLVKRRFL